MRCDAVVLIVVACIGTQDKYLTVAEALQATVISLLEDEEMKYTRSFYYWAAFISHGFASVKLDDALLDQIHERLELMSSQCWEEDDYTKADLSTAILTLTRDAYHRLEEREQTLSRKWSDKWGHAMSD